MIHIMKLVPFTFSASWLRCNKTLDPEHYLEIVNLEGVGKGNLIGTEGNIDV